MTELVLYSLLAAVLLIALWWFLRSRPEAPWEPRAGTELALEDFFPSHSRYFPQLRQVLFLSDEQYMQQRAAPALLRQWRMERRRILLQYLAGLQQDYLRLIHLTRAVSRLSPRVSKLQELELLRLRVRFVFLYKLVRLRVFVGRAPERAIRQLTNLVGNLSSQVETAIGALEENSRAGLRTTLTA